MRSSITRSRMMLAGTVLAATGAVLALSACDPARSGASDPPVSETVAEEAPVASAVSAAADGELIFNQVCSTCHSMQPPPKLAPPMMGILGHYRDVYTDRDEAIAAIVAWVKSPSADSSRLEPMAIERFGLMAPLPLPDSTLHAVASWVWDAYDPAADPHGDPGPGGGPR